MRHETRAHENILDIAASHRLVIDEVSALPVARQSPSDRYLRIGSPGAGQCPVTVIKRHFDRSAPRRSPAFTARENQLQHGTRRAELSRPGFTHHPPDGVNDIALSAAVWTDDADESARELNHRRVCKALET